MLPFSVDLNTKSVFLGIVKNRKMLELTRVLSNQCPFLQQVELRIQAIAVRKVLDLK